MPTLFVPSELPDQKVWQDKRGKAGWDCETVYAQLSPPCYQSSRKNFLATSPVGLVTDQAH